MEKTSPEFLYQVVHLLDGIREDRPETAPQVESLQFRVRALIHLSLQGQVRLVTVGLDMVSPEIEELVVPKKAEKVE